MNATLKHAPLCMVYCYTEVFSISSSAMLDKNVESCSTGCVNTCHAVIHTMQRSTILRILSCPQDCFFLAWCGVGISHAVCFYEVLVVNHFLKKQEAMWIGGIRQCLLHTV